MNTRIIILAMLLLYNGVSCLSQSFTNTANHNFTNSTPYTTTFNVTGVNPGKILRQVTIKFGDGVMYSADIRKTTITLKNPAGNVITLINPASFSDATIGDADRKYLNITLRDHPSLLTPAQWSSNTGNTLSNAFPFNYGYWKSVGSYSSFSGPHNGTWEITITHTSGSTYARKYISSELVFGDDFEYKDIRTTKPNQSCDTKECMQTGTIYLGTNIGYPNNQPNTPLTLNGCQWNAAKNNSSWFYFTASSTTVNLSISGMSKKVESVVATSSDCQNYTLANGGCPTAMHSGSGNFTQYTKQTYAGGYSQNHGYQLTGLTVGQEYILVLDGLDGTPPTQSDFYIEIENGADDGCCPKINTNPTLTETDCNANTGSITLNPTGGASPYTYDFGDGNGFVASNSANGLAAGNHNVTIKDDNDCEKDTTIVIETAALPIIDNIAITEPSCGNSDGEIVVTASGGTGTISYSIDGGATTQADGTFSNLSSGSITITVSDGNCPIDSTFSISDDGGAVPNQPSAITGTEMVCADNSGTYSITDVAGVDYSWTYSGTANPTSGTGNSITMDNITTGGTLTVTPSNSCGNGTPQTFTITIADEPIIGTISTTEPSCGNSDGEITVPVSGGTAPYNISIGSGSDQQGASATFDNLTAGTYNIVVTDANGCEVTQTESLSNSGGPTIDNIAVTSSSCTIDDGTIIVSASGGTGTLEYSSDNGTTFQNNNTFTDQGAGSYNIVVKDINGCETTGTATITQADAPDIALISSKNVTCNGGNDGSIEIEASNGTPAYSYNWSPNGGTNAIANNLSAGTYTVEVTDASGCTETRTVTITAPAAVSATATITPANCGDSDGAIAITANGGTPSYKFNWASGETTSSLTGLTSGSYGVTITDNLGCSVDTTLSVGTSGGFDIEALPKVSTIEEGESIGLIVNVESGVTDETYTWTPADDLSCTDCSNPDASPSTSTTYYVTVETPDGCSSIDSVVIIVYPKDDFTCKDLFIPNMFSPNADGLNDELCIYGDCISSFDISIYNRWGELIYTSSKQNECWDGTYKGKKLNTGVYVYKLSYTTQQGKEVEESGNINLVR